MKTLIVYFSKYGQTEKIARRMAEVLNEAGAVTIAKDVSTASSLESLSGFDQVVLGSPIYAQQHSKEVRRFVEQFRDELNSRSAIFFSVSAAASGSEKQREAVREIMNDYLVSFQFAPDRTEIFAGAIPYRKYNWFLRMMMKWIIGREGGDTDTSQNYEYTNWDRVERFATSLNKKQGLRKTG